MRGRCAGKTEQCVCIGLYVALHASHLTRSLTRCPGPLKIVSPEPARYVDAFTNEIQAFAMA